MQTFSLRKWIFHVGMQCVHIVQLNKFIILPSFDRLFKTYTELWFVSFNIEWYLTHIHNTIHNLNLLYNMRQTMHCLLECCHYIEYKHINSILQQHCARKGISLHLLSIIRRRRYRVYNNICLNRLTWNTLIPIQDLTPDFYVLQSLRK